MFLERGIDWQKRKCQVSKSSGKVTKRQMGEYMITNNIRLGNNGNASIKEFPESIIDEGRLLVMGPHRVSLVMRRSLLISSL